MWICFRCETTNDIGLKIQCRLILSVWRCRVSIYLKSDCPLYIHNTKKACFVRLRNVHIPHTFGCPPVCWMPPICMDAPHVWMVPICLDAPHMPPCMFGHPICLDVPVCLGAPCFDGPVCLDTPIDLDAPTYVDDVWMLPVHIQHKESMLCQTKGVSICPHTFGCPLYINNTKKACFVRLRVLVTPLYGWMPHMFGHPHMFGCSPYVWLPPVCLDAPKCMGHPKV